MTDCVSGWHLLCFFLLQKREPGEDVDGPPEKKKVKSESIMYLASCVGAMSDKYVSLGLAIDPK